MEHDLFITRYGETWRVNVAERNKPGEYGESAHVIAEFGARSDAELFLRAKRQEVSVERSTRENEPADDHECYSAGA